ncbi:MAG: RagB/SusD family nutrient uptake outer membrane protein [Bacteroidia bacterium]|nr:RagB/SusD family nutrient uptake outer membrane protein [Bacteroidia bacterium]MBT8309702.1 RagB/SusD family nutrient uptake outer membrane protein [Bacteroidia bacterium]NND12139.1 RagB/SusD family nutrient uptake outer membrane protein [Flavobacteriaceae bacterium]NNK28944.1 RagB/SusD family nutrient uptake outer membrane protein [Flavobacteriaceae bacterium]NNL61466.1 RagB/SusD family nutrient uptake outer membrane protein [Flavobacteriaceae bacterium]
MKRTFKLNSIFAIMFAFIGFISCTDLELEATDSVLQDTPIFDGVEDPTSSLTSLYQATYGMIGDQANWFALNEVTTDETLVPTRGTDWSDNGIWRSLHAHTWKQDHAFILTVWNQLNGNAFRATELIDPLSNATTQQVAEAKFLRAFNMYWVLDFWGIAPFRAATDPGSSVPMVMDAATTYAFILQDINDAIAGLPTVGPSAATNRASKAAANYLKAKVVLNSERYTGTTPNYNDVITAVDAITADGFALQTGYFDIFTADVDTETIWYANESLSIGNRIWNGLHYNHTTPNQGGGGWNGFSALSEFYDLFEGDANENYGMADGTPLNNQEERRGFVPNAASADETINYGFTYGFVIGQQYDGDGSALTDRSGNPLVMTRAIDLFNSDEAAGIRIQKYHPNPVGVGQVSADDSFRGHELLFRYADAHLMKAEAMYRNGTGDPLTMVNDLRTIRNASPLGSLSDSDLLDERARELYVEFWRRNDMIRFGQFTRSWEWKDAASVGDAKWNLFPIPLAALVSNPNLVQNPGY